MAAVIAYGCLLRKPPFTVPPVDGGDKWVHWLAFMALTLALLWDNHKAKVKAPATWLTAILIKLAKELQVLQTAGMHKGS